MADENGAIADLLPALSPLDDPDAALLDRKAAMAKLFGTGDAAPSPIAGQPNTQQPVEIAQNDAPPQLSPNGNALPAGLRSRVPNPAPAAAPAVVRAVAAPTPSVPGSVTPTGNQATPSLAAGATRTIGLGQQDYAKGSADVDAEAALPSLEKQAAPIQARMAKDAAPIQAYDPVTGKLLAPYKPSIAQRLVRGIDGFARGGLLGIVDPKLGGAQAYGAPNDQYGRQVQEQQQRLASDKQQLQFVKDNYNDKAARNKQVTADRIALIKNLPNVIDPSIKQQTIPIEQQKADADTQNAATNATKEANRPDKEVPPQQQAFESLIHGGMTPVQAYEKIREKPGGVSINTGSWTLAEDKDGNPILYNSKTGQTKADTGGMQKLGTHAKQDTIMAPAEGAMQYAKDYSSGNAYTGPGDEALLEKFFELAKPSTGFRMSQQQIDMLKNAQSIMGSLGAKVRHATVGTWFSPEQRQQIVKTMEDLYKAKKESSSPHSGASQQLSSGGGGTDDNTPPQGAKVRDYTQVGSQ